MARLKQLVLFCSTGSVNYSEPGDTIGLWLDSSEVPCYHRVSPPLKGQTTVCAYRVDLEYHKFLTRTVTLNVDGYGPWAGRDLFLIGELESNGRKRWLPLAHDIGGPHTPRWITQSDHRHMATIFEAGERHVLQDLIVTMSVVIGEDAHRLANVSTPTQAMQMSVFSDDGGSRNLLVQEAWPIAFDEAAGATNSYLFHYHIPDDIANTAKQLTDAQFSIVPNCAWEHQVIQVFGVNVATNTGKLLGSSGEVNLATEQQSDRKSTADFVTVQIPVSTKPVRSVTSENRRPIVWRRTRMPWNKGIARHS